MQITPPARPPTSATPELEQRRHHALNQPIHNSNDPRLTHLLNRAGHIATPSTSAPTTTASSKNSAHPRIREWTTTHYATITLTINTTTDATTPEEAERTAENRLTRTRILEELENTPTPSTSSSNSKAPNSSTNNNNRRTRASGTRRTQQTAPTHPPARNPRRHIIASPPTSIRP